MDLGKIALSFNLSKTSDTGLKRQPEMGFQASQTTHFGEIKLCLK